MSVTMSDDDQPQVCVQGKSTDLLRIFRPNPQDRWSRKPVASQCGICRCDVERLAVVLVTTTSTVCTQCTCLSAQRLPPIMACFAS